METSGSLGRTTGTASVNLDLPISRRGRDFSALGNLTFNANAELDQLSDFGSLSTIGAGANWSPAERLNLITSWTREEGPPTIQQLGDPILTTPDSRIFDFTNGETVIVTATTGGNPDLRSDRRNVLKVGANWQPSSKLDLRLRADYVHQRIENPISGISVTPAIEAAFPGRFVREAPLPGETVGRLVSVDLRPVNFDQGERDQLRLGFDFSKPLKSRRPSQALLDQMRAQFGFAPRGAGQAGTPGGAGAAPPTEGGPGGAAPPPEGGAAREGGFGGGGRGCGGGGGGFGGGNRGRLTFSLTDTITFVDKVTIAPGLELDYLHGDAAGLERRYAAPPGRGARRLFQQRPRRPRQRQLAQRHRGRQPDRRRPPISRPLATFDLRLFANPGDIPELVVKHPWLRGTQVQFTVGNIFDAKPKVRNAAGDLPLTYQPDLLDPLGRTIGITHPQAVPAAAELLPPRSNGSSDSSNRQRRLADSAFRRNVLKRGAMTPVQPVRGTQSLLGRRRRPPRRGGRRVRSRAPPVRLQARRGADDRADRRCSRGRSARPPMSSPRKCTRSRIAAANSITLRPEFTAGICRAYLSEGWQQYAPLKVATHGSAFRYERPQKGRFREFHQLDAEIIGAAEPQADVEMLSLGYQLLRELGIADGVTLELNTLGDPETRDAWRARPHRLFPVAPGQLVRGQPSAARAQSAAHPRQQGPAGPRRSAPMRRASIEYLTGEAADFFAAVTAGVDAAGVPWTRNPRLVRGLDYYRHTAFEFVTDRLGAQGTVIAGGRYDGLIETLGGPHTPAVGWAAGIERLAMMIDAPPAEIRMW